MISTYEVGAVFTIEDRATARLDVIAASLERLAGLASETAAALTRVGVGVRGLSNLATRLSRVEGALSGVAGAADRMAGGIDSAMASIADATGEATARVAALRAELAGAGGAARGLRGGMGDGGGGGGGRGSLYLGAGGLSARIAGIGGRLMSVPAMMGEFTAYEAGKMALHERQSIATSLLNLQLPTTGAAAQPYYSRLYGLTASAAQGTIYSQAQTAGLMQEASKMTGFTGAQGERRFESVFPVAVRMAEVGEYFKLGSASQNTLAAMRYAHLTGRYSAAQLTPGLNQVLNIARYSGMSISSLENTMAQGLPMVRAAGANVDTGAALIGYLSRAGLGRRAGYAIGQMIIGLTETGGPITAHMQGVRGSLLHSLGSHAPHFGHMSTHVGALEQLGLFAGGKLTTLDRAGNINLPAVIDKLAEDAKKFPRAQFLTLLHNAFGIRGLRGASLIDQGMFSTYEKLLQGAPGAVSMQGQLAAQPLQQLQQVWARLKDIATELATAVLPEFQKLMGILLAITNGIDKFLAGNPAIAKIVASTAIGAGVGSVVPGVGTAVGAGVGAAAGIGAVLLGGAHPGAKHPAHLYLHDPMSPSPGGLAPGSFSHAILNPPDMIHKQSWGGGGVHIDHLVIQGAPTDADQTWVERLMGAMADRMHSASKTNLGAGLGWDESPFTQVSM